MGKLKLLVAVTFLIFIIGCHKTPISNKYQISVIKKPITQSYSLQPFNSIVLDGNNTVELVNGSYAATITDLGENLHRYKFDIKDQVLQIYTPKSVNASSIKICVPKLKSITVTGNVTVIAKNFKTDDLIVTAKGNGSIKLEGQYIINKIYQHGNGQINISWINSDNLFIDSNSGGLIYLAGRANNMVARLTKNTKFEARYLRTRKASVFATDKARADISVIETLGAFAVDGSNIFYYKRPHNLTIVTKESGNVLHPGWMN